MIILTDVFVTKDIDACWRIICRTERLTYLNAEALSKVRICFHFRSTHLRYYDFFELKSEDDCPRFYVHLNDILVVYRFYCLPHLICFIHVLVWWHCLDGQGHVALCSEIILVNAESSFYNLYFTKCFIASFYDLM